MVASFYCWGASPVLSHVGKHVVKASDEVGVVDFQ